MQLVKGTIAKGETAGQACLRELAEESSITTAAIEDDLGCWESSHHGQFWSFHLCQAGGPLPEQWSHQTLDEFSVERWSFYARTWKPLGT
ncbi:NUDIX domain-containing protein [Pseudomonas sp. ANT_J28]|uniref:NUDIX domain-containing protein n=1 Tax=Pseudomonas sp. ANT_J28 TaxID=2597352 RepID=UPI002114BB25|nr:NUDIX domain-containing protein [Pseudomonas sp. ANT_J28]